MLFIANMRSCFLAALLLILGAGCDGPAAPEPTPLEDIPVPRVVAEEDYTVTDSGLKIYDIEDGEGSVAEVSDFVSVHYFVWLADGTFIESSYLRQEPFVFRLGTGFVIAGWDEGVAGMRVGGERQLIIPPDLAYGETGRGTIPPNATLTFEIELISSQ